LSYRGFYKLLVTTLVSSENGCVDWQRNGYG